MGGVLSDPLKPSDLSPEDRKACLGGNPNIRAVAKRILDGKSKRVVVLAGAGISVAW